MRRAVGIADVVLSVLFLVLAGLAALGVPGALERFGEEREDLILALTLGTLAAAVGAISLLGGLALIRGRAVGPTSLRMLSSGCIAGAVVLVAISLLAFWSGDPSSLEIRHLWLPALVLGASASLLRRLDSDPGASAPAGRKGTREGGHLYDRGG
jgi:hypothetical protein